MFPPVLFSPVSLFPSGPANSLGPTNAPASLSLSATTNLPNLPNLLNSTTTVHSQAPPSSGSSPTPGAPPGPLLSSALPVDSSSLSSSLCASRVHLSLLSVCVEDLRSLQHRLFLDSFHHFPHLPAASSDSADFHEFPSSASPSDSFDFNAIWGEFSQPVELGDFFPQLDAVHQQIEQINKIAKQNQNAPE